MKKPNFRIPVEVSYPTPEELIVRQMQNSALHFFSGNLSTSLPDNYEFEECVGLSFGNRDNVSISWETTFITDNKRGWLILVDGCPDQPHIDVQFEIHEAIGEIVKEANFEIDFEVRVYAWQKGTSADVVFDWHTDNAPTIDATFEEAFSGVSQGRVDGFLEAMGVYVSIADEQELREFWAELDQRVS